MPIRRLVEYADNTAAHLWIMVGFRFMMHGAQKIFGVLTERDTETLSAIMDA